jgi:hypothetical protein
MPRLEHQALGKAAEGVTAFSEVLRFFGEASEDADGLNLTGKGES